MYLKASVVAAVLVLTRSAAAQSPPDVARLKWIAGCWEQRAGTRVMHEQWMAPLARQMMGMSRTVVGDSVREFETLRIVQRGGTPTYIAFPSGQAETAFAATTANDTLVVFANPAHDFPQRIIYRKMGADSLMARIEGTRNGAVRGVDFPMRKIACGS